MSTEKGAGMQMSTTPKGPCQSGYYCPNTSAIIPCPPGQFCKWWTKEPKVQRPNIHSHDRLSVPALVHTTYSEGCLTCCAVTRQIP